jgi:hydroxymethylpyrimidine/phosphomethylpyrimidine kinase
MFKDIFGKKARMFTALSDADKKKTMIKFAIDKYEIMTPNNEEVKDLVTIDDDGVKSIPTIETLKEVYNNLKNK